MKLSEQGNTRVYVKIARTAETCNLRYDKGLLGPITKRNTRYVFVQSKNGSFEVGQVDVATGELLDTLNYGPDNNRDAKIVLGAFQNN